ncbi:MAG: GUN4 domain-containing protein [Myxacorys californica WJT36-NPBG1]|nr:GUN4 domain-containing protein [Myxacorys californica WJT36-NPBG1]
MNHRISYLLPLGIGLLITLSQSLAGMAADLSQRSVLTAQTTAAPSQDYKLLQNLLAAKNWQAADQETRRILQQWIHADGDLFAVPRANTIPAEAIQTLDRMWRDASGGRFGFGVQQRIWQEALAQNPTNVNAAVKAFGDRVGWTRTTPDPTNFIAPDWLTEPELKYSTQAPQGHLPWAGISWEVVSKLAQAQGCGSCTTDALYLQGERFIRYVPALFNRVGTALDTPSSVNPWQNLQQRQQINLKALYPNISCPVYTLDQAISPNSQILAVSSYSYERACVGATNNSTLALWNLQRGTRLVTLVRGQATESSSYKGQAQEPPTQPTRIVGDVANAIAFTPDSRLIAAGLSNGNIRLWATDTGQVIRAIAAHPYAVRAISISPDAQFLASGSSDQTVKIWNLQTGQVRQTIRLQPAGGIVHTVLISPDGQRVATATDKNRLQLWEISTGRLIRTLVNETVTTDDRLPMMFSPSGQVIAIADVDHSVKLWNATTGARLITLRGHQKTVQAIAFSPDGQTLASSSQDNSVRLWNLKTYQSARTLKVADSAGHPIMPINAGHLAFSPTGQVLAMSALLLPTVQSEPIPTQGIRLWDVASGQTVKAIEGAYTFDFSPNNRFLVTNGQTVQIWQTPQ